jgi:Zn-dependent metalloprotease
MTYRRARRAFAAAVVITTCAATVSALSATGAVAAPAAAPVAANLVPVVTRHSLLGTHVWYRQTFHNLPVLGSYYVRHFAKDGRLVTVDDGRVSVPASLNTAPAVSAPGALRAAGRTVAERASQAARATAGRPEKSVPTVPAFGTAHATLAVVGGSAAALVWDVISDSDSGETETVVDAHTGAARSVTVLSKSATGTGDVFNPNPVVALQDESLRDRGDSNQQVLIPAYKRVALPHLNAGPTLVGKYAQVVAARGPLASSPSHTYVYTRLDDRFEQVNAYYGIDLAQTYIQTLGFGDVNNEAQDLSIDTYAGDNSFYSPRNDKITYGIGGVDDAEDLEVVWHEYGHAIQDAQVPGYGASEQAGATGEGFGDYWAVTMSQPTSNHFEVPCVMDWDSTSYTSTVPHCLRRTDTGKTTDDIDGEVHDDGEIWSNALWDINRALGRNQANMVILEAQFSYTPNNSFARAAERTVTAARALYGNAAAAKVRQAFEARKIL